MTYQSLRDLALSLLEENTTTPIRWTENEIEFFINQALQQLGDYFGGWITETSGAQITVSSDIYAINDNVTRVNDVRLKKTTETQWPKYTLPEQQLPFLQIDGETGQPNKFAIRPSASASDPTLYGVVFYPYPDATYDIRISYNYKPVMSQSSPTDVLAVPPSLEGGLVYLLCAGLMTKDSTNIKESMQVSANYKVMADSIIGQHLVSDTNRMAYNTRGYIDDYTLTGDNPLGW